jgi:hypothetical protein
MAKEFSKVRTLIKDVVTLEAGHPINYGKEVGHFALQVARWDNADGSSQGIAKMEIRDLAPFGKGIALSWKELEDLAKALVKVLKDPECKSLVILDYAAPKPVEKSEKTKALEAAEARAIELQRKLDESNAQQVAILNKLAALEATMADKVGVLA